MASVTKAVDEGRSRFLERVAETELESETSIDARLVALTDPQGAAAEQYRMLLHRLRYARELRGQVHGAGSQGSVVAITSAVRGEGVSITAANLALTAARARDSRVALIDCDLRRGGTTRLFGTGARPHGLSEVLSNKCEVGEALGRYHEGQLAIIPAGKAPAEPAALLASPAFTSLLSQMRSLFDEIFLDVPATLATADAAIVARRSDGVVLVVKAESTPREMVASAVRSLAGANLWGMVLNGVAPSRVPGPMQVVRGQLTSGR